MTKLTTYLAALTLLLFLSVATRAQSIPVWKLDDLKSAIAKTEKPTIYNFWATFCAPCIAEIPYFQRLVKKYEADGVQLVLVSLDAKSVYPKLRSFATRRKFTAPIKFLNETNADLFCPAVDSSWSGAIPASLFVNPKTGYRAFFEDQLKPAQLEGEIRKMVGK